MLQLHSLLTSAAAALGASVALAAAVPTPPVAPAPPTPATPRPHLLSPPPVWASEAPGPRALHFPDMDCGSQTLTQSADPGLIAGSSVWCGTTAVSSATQLARGFTAPGDLTLKCVTFGVRENTGAAWPCHITILLGDVAGPYASLTPAAHEVVLIPAGAEFEFFTVEIGPVLIPAGSSFVVELATPSRELAAGGDGALLSLGFNAAGQTAPSYLRAGACGIEEYQTLASLGFATRHLVMSLGTDDGLETPTLAGLPVSLIGQGTLSVLDGEAIASGAATADQRGLLIEFGDLTMGAGVTFRAISDEETGATVAIEFRGASTVDRLVFRDSPLNPDDAILHLEFDDPSFDTFDMDVYEHGVYVGTLAGQSSGSVRFTDPGGGVLIWKWLKSLLGFSAEAHCIREIEYYENGQIKSDKKSYGGSVGTSRIMPAGGGVPGFVGDSFVIKPSDPATGAGEPPIAIALLTTGLPGIALDVDAAAPTVAIGMAETKLREKGQEFTTQPGVSFKAINERGVQFMEATDVSGDGIPDLVITPLASVLPPEAGDGVLMELGGVVAATLDMAAVMPDPAGACLSVISESVGLPPPVISFDPWPPFPTFIGLRPDFTGTGTGTYTVQILDAAQTVIIEQTGQTGFAGGSDRWPRKFGKLGGQTPCFTICYPDFTTFRTTSGLEFPVHEIRVLAEGAGPAPLIDSLRILATNMAELHLLNPVVELPDFGGCYADCDGSGSLDFFDFLCFQNQFAAGSADADCDGSGSLDFFDFLCFQNGFAAGCP